MKLFILLDRTHYGFRDAFFGIAMYKDLFIKVGLFFITLEIGYSLSEKLFLLSLRFGLPSKKVYNIQLQWNNS